MKILILLSTLLITHNSLLKAQPLRVPNQDQLEDLHEDDLVRQILDLNFMFQGDEPLPYSTEPSPWGALLPDPSYDPNYRVPESERLYPPGYLERREKSTQSVK